MTDTDAQSWRCTVCGYVHQGPAPPDTCPVCGAPAEDFEPHEPPAAATAAPKRWRCVICNYEHDGAAPPETCPVCGASADDFEPIEEAEAEAATVHATLHVVVVGGGIAGVSAAEAARQAAPESRITLIAGEEALPYYRLNLTRYLAGEITRDTLPLHPAEWYDEHDIDLQTGLHAIAVAPDERTLSLSNGTAERYDALVLAVGAHAFVPPISGTDLDGVFSLRTLVDADEILERVEAHPTCVVIGGGILGLEAAGALAQQGLEVTVLEGHEWLMPRQLNRPAGTLLEKHLERLGIGLKKQARSQALLGETRVSGVELRDGGVVPADLVVIATGVRPESYLARKAGIAVHRGVTVDNWLRTSAPGIYAVGDVAEHDGELYGIWGPAQYQGTIAGMNAVGAQTEFGGVPRSNALKVLGVDLLSIGRFEPEDGGDLCLHSETEAGYFHFLFRDGRLQGAILLGDTSVGAAARKAVENGRDFSKVLADTATAEAMCDALGK